MSASESASSSKTAQNASKPEEKASEQKAQQSQLTGLEDDDEFEEFAVQDWDDSHTDLAHLGGAAPGAAKSGGDRLWEDNWDDDDVEDPFSAQLRAELLKTGQGSSGIGGEPMQV